MTNKEKNANLVEKYEKMTYEELGEIEKDPNLPYDEYVIVAITRALKEEEAGIKGIPLEEAYELLLGDFKYKKNNNASNYARRFG